MSGTSEILQEYLVAVGFQTDAISLKKFEDGLTGINKLVVGTGLKVAGAIATVEAATAAFAYSMRKVYFQAELSNTTVGKLKSFEFAGKQIGISAEQMDSALHSMATALRLNPGKMALLDSLTGMREEAKDTTAQLLDLIRATEKMPEWEGAKFAEQFGIDPDTYHQMRDHLAKLIAEQKKAQDIFKSYGINFKDFKKETLDYTEALDTLKLKFEALATVMMSRFEPAFEQLTNVMGKVLQLTSVKQGADLIKKGDWWDASFVLPAGDLGRAAVWKAEGLSDAQIAQKLEHPEPKAATPAGRAHQTGFQAPGDGPLKAPAAPTPAVHPEAPAPANQPGAPGVGGRLVAGVIRPRTEHPLPRDARDNNPGNIRYGKFATRHGAIGPDDKGFAVFPSMSVGFAAAQALLQEYGRHGKNTIRSIVNSWAPAADHNDDPVYIAGVSRSLGGADPDSKLDMKDPSTVVSLSKAIARQEGLPSAMLGQASNTRLGVAMNAGAGAGNKTVSVTQNTNIVVKGDDAASTARMVISEQQRVNGDLVRNLKGGLT